MTEQIEMQEDSDRKTTSKKENGEREGGGGKGEVKKRRGKEKEEELVHIAKHCEGGRILTPARSVRLVWYSPSDFPQVERTLFYSSEIRDARSILSGRGNWRIFREVVTHAKSRVIGHCAPP